MRCSRHFSLLLLISFLILFVGRATVSGFKICSYNLQKFDVKKTTNYRVLHTMTRVVSQCDICLLQNVIDPSGKAIKNLMATINRYDDKHYSSMSSSPLGNSADDMQQYVFLYRTNSATVTKNYQYKSKDFVRPPFILQFQSTKTAIKDFILVPLNTDPNTAAEEIDNLYDVFVNISNKWKNPNVMLLGDFHAACGYVTRQDKKSIRLYSNSSFSWLIKDKVDTTLNNQMNCAYDRIVVYGKPFLKAIEPSSAQVFNFQEEFKLHMSRALEVSDHLPVEVTLKGSALLRQATPLLLLFICAIAQFFLSAP